MSSSYGDTIYIQDSYGARTSYDVPAVTFATTWCNGVRIIGYQGSSSPGAANPGCTPTASPTPEVCTAGKELARLKMTGSLIPGTTICIPRSSWLDVFGMNDQLKAVLVSCKSVESTSLISGTPNCMVATYVTEDCSGYPAAGILLNFGAGCLSSGTYSYRGIRTNGYFGNDYSKYWQPSWEGDERFNMVTLTDRTSNPSVPTAAPTLAPTATPTAEPTSDAGGSSGGQDSTSGDICFVSHNNIYAFTSCNSLFLKILRVYLIYPPIQGGTPLQAVPLQAVRMDRTVHQAIFVLFHIIIFMPLRLVSPCF